jgi:hypothetical protein
MPGSTVKGECMKIKKDMKPINKLAAIVTSKGFKLGLGRSSKDPKRIKAASEQRKRKIAHKRLIQQQERLFIELTGGAVKGGDRFGVEYKMS